MSTTQEKESPYEIGVGVACADGDCGQLHRILIDPASRAITHLVIGKDVHAARLVPASLVDHAQADGIRLICTTLDFDRLEPAEATEVIQPPSPPTGSMPANGGALGGYGGRAKPETVTYDRVPAGEVQLRRGERVHAADGDIGRVQGLVAAPDLHVTHILLTEGHLWTKKEVAVPIRNVVDATFGVQVDLTREEVKDLPPVDLASIS
ncbi:hypothetical protein [Catenulispora subtropica]|uniref:PRC-barrel domain-containing protein n=1 Tax=Catenulispora subtropica TaxID=450798 RepID=A0ABP5D720_9ACTN